MQCEGENPELAFDIQLKLLGYVAQKEVSRDDNTREARDTGC